MFWRDLQFKNWVLYLQDFQRYQVGIIPSEKFFLKYGGRKSSSDMAKHSLEIIQFLSSQFLTISK